MTDHPTPPVDCSLVPCLSRGEVALVMATILWHGLLVPGVARAGDMVTIPPTFQPVFQGSDDVGSVAFAPDRAALYARVGVPVVDVWGLMVWHWPEILGTIAGLALLIAIIVGWRVHRGRRVRGVPYCRKCNYDLTPQVRAAEKTDSSAKKLPFAWNAGTRCPECGTELDEARPVSGKGFLRRFSPTLAVCLPIVLSYAILLSLSLPRRGRVNGWWSWPSTWLAGHSGEWYVRWLSPRVGAVDRVVEIDPATGALVRTIVTRTARTYFTLTVTPDGSAFFLVNGESGVAALSTRDGRVVNETLLPGWPTVEVSGPSVVGFSPDGLVAYVQWWNRAGKESGVVAWPWRRGMAGAPLVRSPDYIDGRGGRATNWPRSYLLRDHIAAGTGAASPRFISIPNFMEAYPTKTFVVRTHDDVSAERVFDVRPLPDSTQQPVLAKGGSILFLASKYAENLVGLDLDSGATVGTVAAPERSGLAQMSLSRDGRYILYATIQNVYVRDTLEKRWCLNLSLPPSLIGPRPSISADGRWVAAACQVSSPPGGGGVSGSASTVVIWDLGEHRLTEGEATDTSPRKVTGK